MEVQLALALHPDKNGAPGADEAFKSEVMSLRLLYACSLAVLHSGLKSISSAIGYDIQVMFLSTLFTHNYTDSQKRAAFDQHGSDPESRFSGMSSGGSPGFSPAAYANFDGEMSPEDLFNMFFGGGMNGGGFGTSPFGGPVFTATFGPGFRATRVHVNGRAPAGAANGQGEARSVLMQLLPLLLLFAFSILSALPSIFSTSTPDPRFTFSHSSRYNVERETSNLGIKYHVNGPEFNNHPKIAADLAAGAIRRGSALTRFESNVEHAYTQDRYSDCRRRIDERERRKEAEIGFFGVGTDWEKVRKIEAEEIESCEELKRLGVLRA